MIEKELAIYSPGRYQANCGSVFGTIWLNCVNRTEWQILNWLYWLVYKLMITTVRKKTFYLKINLEWYKFMKDSQGTTRFKDRAALLFTHKWADDISVWAGKE